MTFLLYNHSREIGRSQQQELLLCLFHHRRLWQFALLQPAVVWPFPTYPKIQVNECMLSSTRIAVVLKPHSLIPPCFHFPPWAKDYDYLRADQEAGQRLWRKGQSLLNE